jgi:ERF superfamily
MSVYAKLNDAREAFHALKLEKTGHNKFAGYKYFELGDFLIPALKVFKDAGLCAVVSFDKDIATMTIVDLDHRDMEVNQSIKITSPMGSAALKGCHEVQNIGAVESYQRRYLWVAALEIVEHDALDATTGSDRKDPPRGSGRDALKDSFDALQPEIQTALRTAAVSMAKASPAEALAIFGMVADNWPNEDHAELKKAVWYLLDSKTRSAIKAHEAAQ